MSVCTNIDDSCFTPVKLSCGYWLILRLSIVMAVPGRHHMGTRWTLIYKGHILSFRDQIQWRKSISLWPSTISICSKGRATHMSLSLICFSAVPYGSAVNFSIVWIQDLDRYQIRSFIQMCCRSCLTHLIKCTQIVNLNLLRGRIVSCDKIATWWNVDLHCSDDPDRTSGYGVVICDNSTW